MVSQGQNATTERVLSVQDVCRKVNLGKSRLYEMIATREFVAPIRISKGRVGFRETEIDEWIMSRPYVGVRPPSTFGSPQGSSLK